MSNPENASPDGKQGQPPRKQKSGDKDKSERPQSNVFWYLLVLLILVIIGFSVMGRNRRGDKLTISEFRAKVKNLEFTKDNVHELVFGLGEIRFQTKPIDHENVEESMEAEFYHINTYGLPDEELDRLSVFLDEHDIGHDAESKPSEWQSLAYLLLIPVVFLLIFVFLFRRMGGAGTAMSFGRSRGKLMADEEIEITFADVAGIDEPVQELREVVEFLRTPAKYQALGGRIPRGVLLVGPPGTGKTLLAKAVAGEAGVPFFSLSGSDFVEMFVGVGAARVRDMFQQAGQKSPSIIFIDELDALGKVRGSGMPGGHDEREQTLNALLVEMDGFSSDQSVIVMGATNRPETLDPALMRPGRFDRHVLVDRPDIKGREAILKVHATKVKMDNDVDLHRLAKLSPGFVGADLANLVNEAALLAARKNQDKVSMPCFEEGIERLMAGLEKLSRIIIEEVKERVAYHECGHALVACSLPHTDPVHKISIIPRGMGALGYTLQLPEDDRQLNTQSELVNRICVLLGGIAAEDIIYQETSTGAQNDLQRATDIARRMVTEFGMSKKIGRVHYSPDQRSPFLAGAQGYSPDYVSSAETMREIDMEVKRIIDECSSTAYDILNGQVEVLKHMTRLLKEEETMNAEQLQEILDQYKTERGPILKAGTHATTVTMMAAHDAAREKSKQAAADEESENGDAEKTPEDPAIGELG